MTPPPRLGAIADLGTDQRWTGAELAEQARRRARALSRHLPADGETPVVAIAHANSPAFFADLFAVWAAGGCAACLNPTMAAPELANVLENLRPATTLVNDAAPDVTGFDFVDLSREPDGDGEPPRPSDLDAPALILFTSGTTGAPKGVVHSHRSLGARTSLNRAHLGDGILSRSLCVLPTHFGHGLIGNCLTPLAGGGDLLLSTGGGIASAARLGETIDAEGVTFMSSVPTFWTIALRVSPPPERGSLRRVHVGSAPLAAALWREIADWAGVPVANMYGLTETANWVAGASSDRFEPEDGLLGALWGGEAAVRDDSGRLRTEGEGEIVLRVPSCMLGYLRSADDGIETVSGGWYATGDDGSLRDGVLRLAGRNAHVINRAGAKVHPEELDALFERHEDVETACAFAMPDPVSGECPAVAVTLRAGSSVEPAALAAWSRERIRAEASPSRVFVVDDLPRSDRGKLLRDDVASICLKGSVA